MPETSFNKPFGGTVEVGNITGVATAIAAGWPGAIFWMWISDNLGMGINFLALGIHYRTRGPAY